MVIPAMPKVNTIGIRFIKGSKTEDLLDTIIHDKLGIPVTELAGLADYGPTKHLVKVKSEQMYDHLVSRYVGYPLRIDNNNEIEVDDLSSYKDRVNISRVPFEMSQETLESLLGRYGQVDKLIVRTSRDRKHRNVPIDQALVFMSVTTPIPSTLWIIEAQQYMYFSYKQQPQTCINCGSLAHKALRCDVFKDTRPENRPNAVSVSAGDTQDEGENVANASHHSASTGGNENSNGNSNNQSNENNESNEDNDDTIENEDTSDDSGNDDNENNVDSDNDVNNNTIGSPSDDLDTEDENDDTNFDDQFACPKCDFKCSTNHGLVDHMKFHTRYADATKSPPKGGISSSQPTEIHQQPSYSNYKKRGASVSPNSSNNQSRKAQKKPQFTTVSKNYTFFKL